MGGLLGACVDDDGVSRQSPFRVAMVHDYPPYTGGGVATAVHELVELLDGIASCEILSSRLADDFADDRKEHRQRMRAVDCIVRVGGAGALLAVLRRADLIVVHWTFSCRRLATLALLIAPWLGRRTVCVVHTAPAHVDYNRFRRLPRRIRGLVFVLLRLMARRCDAVVALSPSHAASLATIGVKPSHVLPVPVSVSSPSPSTRQGGGQTLPVLGVLGELSTLKGADHIPTIVDGVAAVAFFRIVGQGPLRSAIEKAVESLEPERRMRVSIEDPLPPSGMSEFYRSVDCVLLLSATESQCRVAYEAMVAGAVVLGRPVEAIADLIQDKRTGILIDPTPTSIAEALEWMSRNPAGLDDLRYAAAALVSGRTDAQIAGWRSLLRTPPAGSGGPNTRWVGIRRRGMGGSGPSSQGPPGRCR